MKTRIKKVIDKQSGRTKYIPQFRACFFWHGDIAYSNEEIALRLCERWEQL